MSIEELAKITPGMVTAANIKCTQGRIGDAHN
jgi:hypothetical protein